MKKLILTGALAVACVSAFGQGAVLFNNFGGGANAPVFDTDGVTKLGNTFEADLYWGAAGTTSSAALTALGAPATLSGSGYFLGGSRTIPATSGTVVGQVRVWDIASGSSWAAASTVNGAKVGESALFNISLAVNPTPPGTLVNMTSFNVRLVGVIPEPSSLALAGLGLAGMLIMRRRK